MTQPDEMIFVLPAKALERIATGPLGKLVPVPNGFDAPVPFTVLDCFDQSLRHSQRLLIEAQGVLELLNADGQSISQKAGRKTGFVADMEPGPVRDALVDISPLRSLLPMGKGETSQSVLALVDDEDKTQVRAHLRLMTTNKGKGSIVATLIGLRGYEKALDRLREHLIECGATGLAEGGLYRRLFPDIADYQPKPQIDIGPEDRSLDTASEIIDRHLPVARANEAGIIADLDTEFLHDYRIALRKIRSVLSLFRGVYDPEQTEELKARFSALMAPTGRLRDLDVYLLERARYYDLVPPTMQGGLDQLFTLLEAERHAAQAELAGHLRSKDYDKEISDLARLFRKRKKLRPGPNADRGAHDLASELIWKRYRKICRIAAGITPQTPDHEIHNLRIHCKKLRYLMEFFAPVFAGPEFSRLLRPLKKLQDTLGLFNDYSVQQESLLDFAARLDNVPEPQRLEIAQSVGALVVVLHQRQLQERDKVSDSFASFNSDRTQQIFRDLFHEGQETS